jgi:hypothetical protein
MAKISLLHTADVHVETFKAIFGAMDPSVELDQSVEADWLAEAREQGITVSLSTKVSDRLAAAAKTSDVVICTCSTLGPIADEVSSSSANVFRIDRPMMDEAVKATGKVIVALCLESTVEATSQLIEEAYSAIGKTPFYEVVLCTEAWALFEAGDHEAYAQSITDTVCARIEEIPNPGPVVLAQASMLGAAPLLMDLDLPVLASPIVGTRKALEMIAR